MYIVESPSDIKKDCRVNLSSFPCTVYIFWQNHHCVFCGSSWSSSITLGFRDLCVCHFLLEGKVPRIKPSNRAGLKRRNQRQDEWMAKRVCTLEANGRIWSAKVFALYLWQVPVIPASGGAFSRANCCRSITTLMNPCIHSLGYATSYYATGHHNIVTLDTDTRTRILYM